MKNKTLLFIIFIVLILILILVYRSLRNDYKLSDKIVKVIESNTDNSNVSLIRVKDITDFEWDKMVIFDLGTSNAEISEALGFKYKDTIDLMSGMIFVLKNKIVYQERIPYNPERQSKLNIIVNQDPKNTSCRTLLPEYAILEGLKEEIDGKFYYEIIPFNRK